MLSLFFLTHYFNNLWYPYRRKCNVFGKNTKILRFPNFDLFSPIFNATLTYIVNITFSIFELEFVFKICMVYRCLSYYTLSIYCLPSISRNRCSAWINNNLFFVIVTSEKSHIGTWISRDFFWTYLGPEYISGRRVRRAPELNVSATWSCSCP